MSSEERVAGETVILVSSGQEELHKGTRSKFSSPYYLLLLIVGTILFSLASLHAFSPAAKGSSNYTNPQTANLPRPENTTAVICEVTAGKTQKLTLCSLGAKDPDVYTISCAYLYLNDQATHMCLIHQKKIQCQHYCQLKERLKGVKFCCCTSHGCNAHHMLINPRS